MAAQTKTPQTKEAKKTKPASPDTFNSPYQRIQEKVLFSWSAKARPFKRRDREFWVKVFAIAMITGFIIFLIETTTVVILVVAVVFLYYVLNTVEPEIIQYSITNRGIKIADKENPMPIFLSFWFGKRHNDDILVFETINIPHRLELVINPGDKEKIRKILSLYMPEEETPPTGEERVAAWLSKKLSKKE